MKEYEGFLIDDNLNIYSKRTKRMLNPYLGSDGYMAVAYRKADGKMYHQRVHILYAHCFIPNPFGYKYVNHIDSDKTNNSLSNLEWCTNSYNVKHGWDSGNRTHKNNTHVVVYDLNNNLIGEYKSIRQCGSALNLDRHKIARILKGELRKDYLGYYFSYNGNRQEAIESIA